MRQHQRLLNTSSSLELAAHKSSKDRDASAWKEGPIPVENAIIVFYSVTLSEGGYERTASVLIDELGFVSTQQDGSRFRYEIPRGYASEEENIGGNSGHELGYDEISAAKDWLSNIHKNLS